MVNFPNSYTPLKIVNSILNSEIVWGFLCVNQQTSENKNKNIKSFCCNIKADNGKEGVFFFCYHLILKHFRAKNMGIFTIICWI